MVVEEQEAVLLLLLLLLLQLLHAQTRPHIEPLAHAGRNSL